MKGSQNSKSLPSRMSGSFGGPTTAAGPLRCISRSTAALLLAADLGGSEVLAKSRRGTTVTVQGRHLLLKMRKELSFWVRTS